MATVYYSEIRIPQGTSLVPADWLPKDEFLSGSYGSMAGRTPENRSVWSCSDSDYSWRAVVDDFGVLTPISSLRNMRGY